MEGEHAQPCHSDQDGEEAVSSSVREDRRLHVALADLPPTVTVPEAGRICGIGRSAAYRAAATGELPTIRIGRRLLVPTAPLLRMLGVEEG
jgi:hypothetical protein